MNAFSLPKKTDEQLAERSKTIQSSTKNAIKIPYDIIQKCKEIIPEIKLIAEKGNLNAVSDAGVGALSIKAAAMGAALNVRINLKSIEDDDYKKMTTDDTIQSVDYIIKQCDEIIEMVNNKIDNIN